MSTGGLIAGVLCIAVAVVVALSTAAWAATASRERDIEGGRR